MSNEQVRKWAPQPSSTREDRSRTVKQGREEDWRRFNENPRETEDFRNQSHKRRPYEYDNRKEYPPRPHHRGGHQFKRNSFIDQRWHENDLRHKRESHRDRHEFYQPSNMDITPVIRPILPPNANQQNDAPSGRNFQPNNEIRPGTHRFEQRKKVYKHARPGSFPIHRTGKHPFRRSLSNRDRHDYKHMDDYSKEDTENKYFRDDIINDNIEIDNETQERSFNIETQERSFNIETQEIHPQKESETQNFPSYSENKLPFIGHDQEKFPIDSHEEEPPVEFFYPNESNSPENLDSEDDLSNSRKRRSPSNLDQNSPKKRKLENSTQILSPSSPPYQEDIKPETISPKIPDHINIQRTQSIHSMTPTKTSPTTPTKTPPTTPTIVQSTTITPNINPTIPKRSPRDADKTPRNDRPRTHLSMNAPHKESDDTRQKMPKRIMDGKIPSEPLTNDREFGRNERRAYGTNRMSDRGLPEKTGEKRVMNEVTDRSHIYSTNTEERKVSRINRTWPPHTRANSNPSSRNEANMEKTNINVSLKSTQNTSSDNTPNSSNGKKDHCKDTHGPVTRPSLPEGWTIKQTEISKGKKIPVYVSSDKTTIFFKKVHVYAFLRKIKSA